MCLRAKFAALAALSLSTTTAAAQSRFSEEDIRDFVGAATALESYSATADSDLFQQNFDPDAPLPAQFGPKGSVHLYTVGMARARRKGEHDDIAAIVRDHGFTSAGHFARKADPILIAYLSITLEEKGVPEPSRAIEKAISLAPIPNNVATVLEALVGVAEEVHDAEVELVRLYREQIAEVIGG